MGGAPDPDWYFEQFLRDAEPGGPRSSEPGAAALWRQWWRQQARGPDPLPASAVQGFVLGVDDQRRLGISRSRARHAVRQQRWLAPGRGAIAPLAIDDESHHVVARRRHALTAAAAVRGQEDCVVSGRSAAILHGLPTMSVPRQPELTRTDDRRLGPRVNVHVLGARLPSDSIERWFGVPLTVVARTLVDLGRHDRRDALMAADAALHENLVTEEAVERVLEQAAGWPGVRQARSVLALMDGRAESPLESLIRLALHDSGFPAPEPQFLIGGYRVDLCWPERRLVVEVDGRIKYQNRGRTKPAKDPLWDEKLREINLRNHDYRVERVIWSQVVDDWPRTRDRIWAAFRG